MTSLSKEFRDKQEERTKKLQEWPNEERIVKQIQNMNFEKKLKGKKRNKEQIFIHKMKNKWTN